MSAFQTGLKKRLMQKQNDGLVSDWFVTVMFFVFRLKRH